MKKPAIGAAIEATEAEERSFSGGESIFDAKGHEYRVRYVRQHPQELSQAGTEVRPARLIFTAFKRGRTGLWAKDATVLDTSQHQLFRPATREQLATAASARASAALAKMEKELIK